MIAANHQPTGWNHVQDGAFGVYVEITHGNGWHTGYAHLRGLLCYPGQLVRAGQAIGISGSTGLSTGPHLHFQVIKHGTRIDPTPYLPLGS